MITNLETLDIMYQEGRRKVLSLQTRAVSMTGTEIIAEEQNVPLFNADKDYSEWPMSSPVIDDGQVWLLIQPHNPAHYPGLRPAANRSCWGLAHTTDPAKAKPYVAPYGTSGLYMIDECCTENGLVYRNMHDNNPYAPSEYPQWWEQTIL